MSDTPLEPNPEAVPAAPAAPEPDPPPEAWFPSRRGPVAWWLPGLVLGAVAGAAFGLAAALDVSRDPAPRGTHRATARVLVQPPGDAGTLSEAERQRLAFLARDRDLLTRALAAPEVAGCGPLDEGADPVGAVERRLTVEVSAGGAVTLALLGNAPDDLRAILDQLVARFAETLAALNRKAHDDRTNQLEKLAAVLRQEIELQEKAVELLARAHGPTAPGATDAPARDRFAALESELVKGEAEVALLTRRVELLKRRRAAGADPDPVEAARLVDADPRVVPLLTQRADAAVNLERERALAPGAATVKDLQGKLDRAEKALAAAREPVRKEVEALLRDAEARRDRRELDELEARLAATRESHEALKRERDAAHKALAPMHGAGASVEGLRRTLVAQQDQLDKVTAQLGQLRVAGTSRDARVHTTEPATAEPVRGPWRRGAAWGAALRAFAIAFGLATAFQLTGLAFRAAGRASGPSR